MAEDTASRTFGTHDQKIRRQAVRILAAGAGHRSLAQRLGIPEATARQWARAYAVGGASAVMNAGERHRVYPYELKLSAVRDHVEGGMSLREAMVKHGIPSESSLKSWCRRYRAGGCEALRDKPRGRKPKQTSASPAASAVPACADDIRGASSEGPAPRV